MSNKKSKNKSLSEKVAESLNPNLSGSEYDSDSETAPKLIDFDEDDYEDATNKSFSQIRKQNVKLLSEQCPKYSGEVVSRKNLNTSDDDTDEDHASREEDHASPDEEEDEFEEQDEGGTKSDSEGDSDQDDDVSDEESVETNFLSAKNRQQETEKGLSVQNQLTIWEKFLEIRIHSQKMLNKANSLPYPEYFSRLSLEKDYMESSKVVKASAEVLLEKLTEMQENLSSQFSEINKLGISARKRSNTKSNENGEPSSKRFGPVIESNFEKFRPYRNAVLLKWDDRTKLLTPSGAAKKKSLADDFDIVKKVDSVLIKRDELIAKSQKVKGNYKLFGHKQEGEKEEVSSPHIYDDTDFYHSQLRELIEFKSNVSADAYDVTKQYAELQKLRQKMKKKVDTRASKGRKIRYAVHHKLINFMAPNSASGWEEESKNELYRSLFAA